MASGPAAAAPLFRRHVRRPRLTTLLDEIRAQAIVLVAPPGYGKNVLASEWTQGRKNVVWYRATRASADLATFALAVAAAVEPLAPGTSERLRKRVGAGLGDEAPRVLAELLAPAVEEWPAGELLVLDDYHRVQESQAAEEFTDWLLTLTPIRLLVTTRTRPPWASARRVLYGEVAEVGRDELALTAAEAQAVLARLPADVARSAIARAQGWPALVGLAALSAAAPETPHAAVSDGLYRYFADEVLKSEPPDVQQFMSYAAVPLTVDAATARALGVAEPERALDRLASEGLLEPAGDAFRFHPLLRDFLRRRVDPERLLTLTDTAAKHALAAGNVEDAFELAVESGRLERAAEVAASAARDLLTTGRTETLERWLDACGPAALLHPTLVVARASILLRRGNASDAASLAHDMAARLSADDPQASRAWYVSAQANQLLCRWTDALTHARTAVRAATNAHDRTNALLLATLAGAALEVDVSDELEALDAIAAGDLHARFRFASAQMRVAFTQPSLAGTWERVAAVIPLIEHCDGPMLRSDVLAGAAYLNVLRAEYDTAAALGEHAAAVSAESKLRLPHAFSTVYLAAADVGRRRFGTAERALGSVREVASLERRGLRIVLETVRLKLSLARGHEPTPPPLDDLVVDGTSPRQQAVYAALAALAAARIGDSSKARELARWSRETSGSAEARYLGGFAEAFANGAADPRRLTRLVQRTLDADVPDAFVVAYRAFPELLSVAADDPRCATLVRPLVRRAGDDRLAEDAGLLAPAHTAPAHEALTPREAEVLALMSEGLSNAEIARRLFISPSTTKVHVHHILEKLGSKSRFEAVLKSGVEAGVTEGDKGGDG